MKADELNRTVVEKPIGIILDNIDLSKPLDINTIMKIQSMLNEHRVVIFRNQALSDDHLKKIALNFGTAFIPDSKHPVLGSLESANSVVIVGNNAPEFKNAYLGHQEVLPHSDHQWLQQPSAGSILYAVDVNVDAAPTIWFDMVHAYNTLDVEICNRITDLKIITYNPFFRPFGTVSAKYVDKENDIPPGETFSHPLVRTHPLTSEKILYCNMAYEMEIENVPFDIGSQLMSELHNHVVSKTNRYVHNWQNGDVVFWDNRATLHYRPAFESHIRRVLKRVTIAGEVPF
jgi:taurine dioxygenase